MAILWQYIKTLSPNTATSFPRWVFCCSPQWQWGAGDGWTMVTTPTVHSSTSPSSQHLGWTSSTSYLGEKCYRPTVANPLCYLMCGN